MLMLTFMFVYVCIINNFGSVLGNHYIVYKSNAKFGSWSKNKKKKVLFFEENRSGI